MAKLPIRPRHHRTVAHALPRAFDPELVQRERMRMMNLIQTRGIDNKSLLQAMAAVPRHLFVQADSVQDAYGDFPLAIGWGQTISQPFIVAYMLQVADLQPEHTVLEIGMGSGYETAILSRLVRSVYTVEILPALIKRAQPILEETGNAANVYTKAGNGYQGWFTHAPYDRIIVTAAPPQVPQALLDQLATPGKLVIPVGTVHQKILIFTKTGNSLHETSTLPVRFVPMTGRSDDEL